MLSTIWLVLLLQSFVSCLAAPHEIFFDVDSMEDPGITRSYNWGQRPERSQNGNATMSFEFNGTGLKIMLRTFYTYGLVAIELDEQVTMVDTYSKDRVYTTCALCLSTLEDKKHSVRLTNMGPTGGTTGSGGAWMNIASLSYVTDDVMIEPTISATFSSTPTLSTGGGTPPSRSDITSIGTTTTSSTADPSSNNALSKSAPSVGVVAGSVVAGVILFALLVSGTLWLICRRRRARRQPAITFTPQFVSPYQHDIEDTPPRQGLVSEKRRRAAILHGTKPHMPSSEASSAREVSAAESGRLSSDDLRDEVRQLREIVVQLATPPQYASQQGH